jgi:hypothetical protein
VDPDLPVGVVKAERNEVDHEVIVASVQTLSRTNRLVALDPERFGLVIVDEAHHAAASSYRRILDYFHSAKVAGFSATLSRVDNKGLGDIFESPPVIQRDILWGIVNGWLTDVRGKRVEVEDLDLSDVRRTAGDYQDKSLGDALIKAHAPDVVAAQYNEHARREDGTLMRGLIFWPSVVSAYEGQLATEGVGIRSSVIDGRTPVEDRQLIYKAMRHGDLDVIHNCMVLTEGFDLPEIECITIARPTTSPALYVQMVGRGLRPSPSTGKRECLLLDVVGVSGRLRLASPADLSETKINLRDGESLSEASDRIERGIKDRDAGIRGTITVKDVDLFATASENWLQTERGFWFIPAGRWIVTVIPTDTSEDLYDVWAVYTHWSDRQPNYKVAGPAVLDYAKAWAESHAMELDAQSGIVASIAKRSAGWRREKKPPTPGMLKLARNLRIIVPEDATKGQVSDLIDIATASRIIDTYQIPTAATDAV